MRSEADTNPEAIDEGPLQNLMGKTLRGLQVSGVFTVSKSLVDIAAQLLLVRILAPEIFGVVAFAVACVGFFNLFSDLGGQKFIIRRKQLSREEVNTVFTLEILVACTIGLLWYNLSPLALEMLGKPQIIPYAQLLSLYLITERLQTPKALIEKELKFGRSNLSLFLGFFAGGVTSVILALLGFGAYSIIVGLIARSFVTTFFYWCFAPYPPHPTLKLVEVTQFLKFGLPLTLTGLLVFYYWNVDYFIVGKLLGDRELGYYFIAFKFPHYMIQLQIVVSTVVYPAFSKAADKNQLMRGFSLVTKYSAALVLLPCLLVLVQGEDIVRYVLGEKWLPSLFSFQVFTVLATLRIITGHWVDVYISKGITKPIPLLAALNSITVTLLAYIGACKAGIAGVSVGVFVAATCTILIATNVLLKRVLKVRYLSILSRPLVVGLASFAVAVVLNQFSLLGSSVANFGVKLIVVSVFYVAFFLLLDKKDIKELSGKAWKTSA